MISHLIGELLWEKLVFLMLPAHGDKSGKRAAIKEDIKCLKPGMFPAHVQTLELDFPRIFASSPRPPSLRDCGSIRRLNTYFSPNPLSSRLRAEPARPGSGCRRSWLRMPVSCPLDSAPGCLDGQHLSLSIRCSIIPSTGTDGGPQGCSHVHGIMCDRDDDDVLLWLEPSQSPVLPS